MKINETEGSTVRKLLMVSGMLICGAVVSGCSTVSSVAQYKASTKNVIAIQDQVGGSNKKVKLTDFTSAPNIDGSWCRAVGPISLGSSKNFGEFVHEALHEELFMAGVYSSTAPTTLSGHLDNVAFSSFSPAYWEITLTLSSSNGASYQTKSRHDFDTSFAAVSACKNLTDAFPGAVQETLKRVVSDARFKTLM
jgi:hypothetical protein